MNRHARPTTEHVYENILFDSSRWDGFTPRDDDIIICTSYKAGTTWMQMICALLVLQKTDFGRPLTTISPWLDMLAAPIEDVLAVYEAQQHRRFIKTHTPLDGLPYFDNVTYLYCGRDPRDVFMSGRNHQTNISPEAMARLLRQPELSADQIPEMPSDVNAMFQVWLTKGSFPWEQDGFPFWSHLNHARTYWEFRHLPNVHLLHYADLQADLEGQMRSLADLLNVKVREESWLDLVRAATFEHMKKHADQLSPDVDHGVTWWVDNSRFFNRGTSGQWRDALSEASLRLYERVKRERLEPALATWLEQGSLVAGAPKAVPRPR
jgi:aryl sulfotransferase